MNTHEELERIVRDGDPLLICDAVQWALSDPNMKGELGKSLDLLIARQGHCESEATQAADGVMAVIRGYLENRARRAA